MGGTIPHSFPQPGSVGTSQGQNILNPALASQKVKGQFGASLNAPTPTAPVQQPNNAFFGGGGALPDPFYAKGGPLRTDTWFGSAAGKFNQSMFDAANGYR